MLLFPAPGSAQLDDDALLAAMVTTIGVHDAAALVGLVPEPTTSLIAESTQYGASLLLKAYRPLFAPPPAVGPLLPNQPDQCGFSFVLPRATSEHENFLGLITLRKPIGGFWHGEDDPASVAYADVVAAEACLDRELPLDPTEELGALALRRLRSTCALPGNNWGILGPPERSWAPQTEVRVGVASLTAGIAPTANPQVVHVPAGDHTLFWTAENRYNVLADIVVPPILMAVMAYAEAKMGRHAGDVNQAIDADRLSVASIESFGEVTYGRALKTEGWKASAGKKLLAFAIDKGVPKAFELATESYTSNLTTGEQLLSVYDVFPPQIDTATEVFPVEAMDLGGTRTSRVLGQLTGAITALDACDREPIVSHDAPEFLPLGETIVTWRAQDRGPNPDDGRDYFDQVVQRIVVADTQPPLLLAPPSRVVETIEPELDREAVDVGFAVAVDLADPQPTITDSAPDTFTRDSRTAVTWTATDDSGNATQKSQWITVKTTGTNTTPAADPKHATTLTSQPVDVTLTASDADFLDGRFDPLWFSIVERPEHGEFVAPLYPFFIEDARTDPRDVLGPGFPDQGQVQWIDDNYCANDEEPPRNFVFEPSFVHVTDDGHRYVLDKYFHCVDPVEVSRRISWWSPTGEFLGQQQLSPDDFNTESFVIDRDGFLYYTTIVEPGSSSASLVLRRCRAELSDVGANCPGAWVFSNSGAQWVDNRNYANARTDSARGVAYVTDQGNVYAYSLATHAYLRALGPTLPSGEPAGDLLGGNCSIPGAGFARYGMEVDVAGGLYVADSCGHRIHKFAPPTTASNGAFVPGAYVGWLGACTTSTNNACDEESQRSKGYSCTDATCSVSGAGAGGLQGQLNHPLSLSIDPNDVLYVADFDNSRVQRFAPDGTFAGEAVSEGSGINQGERSSFVLGNMGRPRTLSVNSSQFFVVDRLEKFVHIFSTLPFKDIDDDSVTVTYVSPTDFHGAQDRFRYRVTDGLAQSAPATVTIDVARNFRPPVAIAAQIDTEEDTSVAIEVAGDDPDGILGVDFNGLDTLTYAIASPPLHGDLIGDGASWTYAPDLDFAGADSFTFVVDDGVFTSEPALVAILVEPENDPPVVTLVPPARIGAGFPAVFEGSFEDEPSASYTATLAWGDGDTEQLGEPVAGETSAALTGIVVAPSSVAGTPSRLVATHTYLGAGGLPAILCVRDADLAQGCDARPVLVEDLVSLGIAATASAADVADDAPFHYAIEVRNAVPATPVPGQAAAGVAVTTRVPEPLLPIGVQSDRGSCSLAGREVTCALGTLPNGGAASVRIDVQGPGTAIYDALVELEVSATTQTPAVAADVRSIAMHELLADPLDTDGDGMSDRFENAYGLDPESDADAADDADLDDLDNLAEFLARTDATRPDTDDDGLGDAVEVEDTFTDPTLADSDEDSMSDGFEVAYGLNPLHDDADGDLDRDGQSNYDEYVAMTNPADTDGDLVSDAIDNCPIPNAGQLDTNADGIGDACDCHPVAQDGCVNPGLRLAEVGLDGGVANPPDSNELGSVGYAYEIAAHEVTNADYLEFLASVASLADPHGLYDEEMGRSPHGGIAREMIVGGFLYFVKPNGANKPVNFVSWLDAARFVNWLENGRPIGVQGPGTTERGVFDLTLPDAANAAARNPAATWSLPSEDEWYKAGYYASEGAARYFLYPNASDTEPRPLIANNLGDGFEGDLNYADGTPGKLPRLMGVATGEAGAAGPWGTWDQGGNVAEWLAAPSEEGKRLVRGGSFRTGSAAFRSFPSPDPETLRFDAAHAADDVGFRVVRIPEPAAGASVLVAIAALLVLRWRSGSQ